MPSQLKSLRLSLHNAGITGRPQKSKKKRSAARLKSKSEAAAVEANRRNAALESIREQHNPFDVKSSKSKFQVINARKAKGSEGRPSERKGLLEGLVRIAFNAYGAI